MRAIHDRTGVGDLPLFGAARASDPETSHVAAKRAFGALSVRIVRSLQEDGPATAHALAERLGLELVSVSPRMRPLAKRGFVQESDRKEKGRIVWEIKP